MVVETPEGKGKDANIGLAPPQASTELAARSGILGIIDGMAGMTQDDLNADYAERVVEKVATAIRLFYTNLKDGSVDEDEITTLCRMVRLVVGDKALRKSVKYMTRIFPNLIQYQRDPSHAIRIAIKEPLMRAERFDASTRKINSDFRCWLAAWFGKDWIFFLWIAFGNVDKNMMEGLRRGSARIGSFSCGLFSAMSTKT